MRKFIYGKYSIISQVLIRESITRLFLHIHFGSSIVWPLLFINPDTFFPFAGRLWLDVRLVFLCYNMTFCIQNSSRAVKAAKIPRQFFSSRDAINRAKKGKNCLKWTLIRIPHLTAALLNVLQAIHCMLHKTEQSIS